MSASDADNPSWVQRPRPIGGARAYRLDGVALTVETAGGTTRFPLAAAREVRFFYAPSNVTARAFRTRIRFADGRKVVFGNVSWRSLTDIERDDARYHRFVAALSAAIAAASPQVRFAAGRGRLPWLALTLASGIFLSGVAGLTVRGLAEGGQARWLGVVIAAVALWQVGPMVWLNRPRRLPAGSVPAELVPGGPEQAG